ncbi:MAG: transposase [Candidatus Sedimenticola sp. 20ELBAFRAG]
MKMIPIAFDRQILPGSFEYSLAWLIDQELDLTRFDAHYNNDNNGRPAYDPRLLLKIVILAYSKGITSSRRIAQLCQENIIFMALSTDSRPHFSTLADFISRSPETLAELFGQIVLMCDKLGLIGKEMFAIDGCKLPSNASKEWSGTHEELRQKHQKIDRAVRRMVKRHKEEDQAEKNADIQEKEKAQIKKLRAASRKIKAFLYTEEIPVSKITKRSRRETAESSRTDTTKVI